MKYGDATGQAARILALALGLSALPVLALAEVDKDVAEDLMHKSGLWDQMGAVTPQVLASMSTYFAKPGTKLSEAEQARIRAIVTTDYSAAHLRAVATASLAAGVTPEIAADVLVWFKSPLGATIAKLEQASSAGDTDPAARLRLGAETLAKASPKRQTLLQRLAEVSHSAEATTTIVIDTALAVRQGLASVQPDLPGPSMEEVRAALEKRRPELLQAYGRLMVASFAGAYAPLSDEDLERYIAFMQGASGARFNVLCMLALHESLTEAAHDLGHDLPTAKSGANL